MCVFKSEAQVVDCELLCLEFKLHLLVMDAYRYLELILISQLQESEPITKQKYV